METPAVGEDSMKVFASLMVGGLVALLAGLGGVRADPLKIRVAWIVPASNIASILFAKPGIAQHLGTSYVMEPVHFQGTPPMVTALAVDDLDVAVLGYSSLDLAVQNAGMDDLRIVADEFQDGVDDYFTNLFMVRADSPIHKVEDLKGKVLATNAGGSAVDVAMRAVLHKAGLVENRDYTVVEAGFGAMKAMLGDRKVDLVPAVVPFSQDAELRKNARVLFSQKDAMGPSELGFWVARQGFLEKHRAAMLDFLEDTLRATRWYLDPANHDEAVKIAADFSKAPPALFSDWLFTKKDYYRDANLIPNLDALQANVDLQRDLGFFTGQIDVRKYTDLSLVEEAAKRLK
jgi:NitT/TauT family transport system substrate-binding protein